MTEYIKKEDVVILLRGLNGYCLMQTGHPNEQIKVAIKTIRTLPAADVVEVVRCKDCKYWEQSKIEPSFRVCTYVYGATFVREADDFCSRAEKKEES